MSKRKRNALNLEEKMAIIKLSNQGLSARKIADEMSVGRMQILKIVENKQIIIEDWKQSVSWPKNGKNQNRRWWAQQFMPGIF